MGITGIKWHNRKHSQLSRMFNVLFTNTSSAHRRGTVYLVKAIFPVPSQRRAIAEKGWKRPERPGLTASGLYRTGEI